MFQNGTTSRRGESGLTEEKKVAPKMKYYYVYEMKALSFYQIFLLFIFYSFVGWICEVAYCSISQRRFVNRGFLYGPICPIYGCGAIIIFSFLMPLSDNLILLFFASMILTTILEYFTSWVMEKLFATKWWDYSNYKFNIHGRVCLLNSVLFGIMGIVAVHFVHPFVLSWLYKIDGFWTKFLALSLLGIFLVDLFFTLRSLVNFKLYLKRFEAFIQGLIMRVEKEEWIIEVHDNIEEFVKKIKEKLSHHNGETNALVLQHNEKLKNEIDRTLEKFLEKRKSYNRFLNKFPDLKSKKYTKSLEHIKSLSKK
ncbi:MAG: putative ABC transporter permease [Spirochaetaceae bacterium]|nr:putative ABC transporter permease [Spirochaetaceae bacterium]